MQLGMIGLGRMGANIARRVTDLLGPPASSHVGSSCAAFTSGRSPRAVLTYIVGGKTLQATIGGKSVEVPITRKFFGDDGIVERSIVTLASERALLLVGEPGTGKSWLSEHLAAAISGS